MAGAAVGGPFLVVQQSLPAEQARAQKQLFGYAGERV